LPSTHNDQREQRLPGVDRIGVDNEYAGVVETRSPPHGYRPTPRQPQRYLDPALAKSIAEAKEKTCLSWRQLALLTGLSHSFLIQLAGGVRVPSDVTVELIADYLPIEPGDLEELRQVAVVKRRYPH
jgi:hypothetical protein